MSDKETLMKTTVTLALGALTAASLLAAPVLAQPYGGPPPTHREQGYRSGPKAESWEVNRRMRWIQERIMRGRHDGSLDAREYNRVETQLHAVNRDANAARVRGHGHIDDRARADLEARLDRLNDEIHWLRHNDERRPW
jgi:uncharacterized membrane protein YebE (DUF533 family)